MYRKNFIITYLGSNLTTLIILVQALLVTPYLLKETSTATYAAWIFANEILMFFSFLDFGTGGFIFKKISYFFVNKDNSNICRYFWINVWIIIMSFPIVLIITFFILYIVNDMFTISTLELLDFKVNVWLSALSLYFACLSYPCNTFFIGVQSVKWANLVSLLATFFGLVVSILLILNKKGLYCAGLSYIIRFGLNLLGQGYCVYLYMKYKMGKEESKYFHPPLSLIIKIYKSSYDGLILSIYNNLLMKIDTMLLPWCVSPQTMVCYSISKKILDMTKVVIESLNSSLMVPYTHKYYSLRRQDLHFILKKIILNFYFALYIFMSFYLLLNKNLILFWLKNSNVLLDLKIILLITINLFFSLLSILLMNIIFVSEYKSQIIKRIALDIGFKIILGIASLLVYGITGMLIIFVIIGAYTVIKNKKFISQFIVDEINSDSFYKIVMNNFSFFLGLTCINFILFYVFEKFILYNSLLLFLQIGLLIWYHPYLDIKGIISSMRKKA